MRKRFHLGRVTPWWLLEKIDRLFIKLCWAELVMWKLGYEVETFSRAECSSPNGRDYCDYCGKPRLTYDQFPEVGR